MTPITIADRFCSEDKKASERNVATRSAWETSAAALSDEEASKPNSAPKTARARLRIAARRFPRKETISPCCSGPSRPAMGTNATIGIGSPPRCGRNGSLKRALGQDRWGHFFTDWRKRAPVYPIGRHRRTAVPPTGRAGRWPRRPHRASVSAASPPALRPQAGCPGASWSGPA